MSISGRRPIPTTLRLVTGNPGGHALPDPVPELGPIKRPAKMPKAVAEIWDEFIAPASWLTWADSPSALLWCHLRAEWQKSPKKMIAARIAQMRAVGHELGFGDERGRRRGNSSGQKKDLAAKYLGGPKGA